MKFIAIFLVIAISQTLYAACPDGAEIPLVVEVTSEAASSNHEGLENISVTLPFQFAETQLTSLELLYGEVYEFIIPLAYKIESGKAIAGFSISKSYLSSLELGYKYSGGSCNVSAYRQIGT